jgi:hypothetical protein
MAERPAAVRTSMPFSSMVVAAKWRTSCSLIFAMRS